MFSYAPGIFQCVLDDVFLPHTSWSAREKRWRLERWRLVSHIIIIVCMNAFRWIIRIIQYCLQRLYIIHTIMCQGLSQPRDKMSSKSTNWNLGRVEIRYSSRLKPARRKRQQLSQLTVYNLQSGRNVIIHVVNLEWSRLVVHFINMD